MLTLRKIRYVVGLLAPLAFLPLFSPLDLLPTLPILGGNLLSLEKGQISLRAHYSAHMIPFLLLAAINGFGRLNGWVERHRLPESVGGRKLTSVVLGIALALSLGFGARTVNQLKVDRLFLAPRHATARHLIAQIPPEASVSTQYPYVPHLSKRHRIYLIPDTRRSDYLFIDLRLRAPKDPFGQPDTNIQTVAQREGFDIISEADSFLLLRRQKL